MLGQLEISVCAPLTFARVLSTYTHIGVGIAAMLVPCAAYQETGVS